MQCYVDHGGNDLSATAEHNLTGCINTCENTPGCQAVSWAYTIVPGATGTCFLHSAISLPGGSNIGIWGAVKLFPTITTMVTTTSSTSSSTSTATTLSCPTANNTIFTANSLSYYVECGFDRNGGNLPNIPVYVNSLDTCINLCANTSPCVDVSWVVGSPQGPCYLKYAIGNIYYNAAIWGARQLFNTTTTITTTTASTTYFPTSTTTTSASITSTAASMTSSTMPSSALSTLSTATSTPTAIACPAANGTTFTVNTGAVFLIECGINRQGSQISITYPGSLVGCATSCAAMAGCVNAIWTGGGCYLKSSFGTTAYDNNVGLELVMDGTIPVTITTTTTTTSILFSSTSSN